MSDLSLASAHLDSLRATFAAAAADVAVKAAALRTSIIAMSDANKACGPAQTSATHFGEGHRQPLAHVAEFLKAEDDAYKAPLTGNVIAVEYRLTLPAGTAL